VKKMGLLKVSKSLARYRSKDNFQNN